jgi:CRISPR-associated protein (TIGR03984 family)
MSEITGCVLRSQDSETCARWLDLVTASGPTIAEGHDDLIWLLAHCDDGVVWGKREAARWRLSSMAFPEVSPQLSAVNLQQLRLFGPLREVLLWRSGGGLFGRELADTEPIGKDNPLRPEDQTYVLLGDRFMAAKEGFTLTGDARGSRHAVPQTCQESQFGTPESRRGPLRLQVRHYFVSDPRSGLVRVVASRLIHVTGT